MFIIIFFISLFIGIFFYYLYEFIFLNKNLKREQEYKLVENMDRFENIENNKPFFEKKITPIEKINETKINIIYKS
jgi:hypothetical protein